ncbi:alpha/beta-hydrolase [Tothia fuscella]|uniref:feruloyl esterase n=1 Tax=Tothia fuscella TaxID=1048955 RepID=A0A9P4NPR0_9PEZI|nr:alpha/beta-hydrolase [Tothia fuscella]
MRPLSQLFFVTLLTTVWAAPRASPGCGKTIESSLTPGGPSKSFTHESDAGQYGIKMRRRIRIALPPKYKDYEPAPLILAFHGKHRNGTSFEHVTQFSDGKLNDNAVTVFPDGIDLRWSGDPSSPELKRNNDITYTLELLTHITESFCIDLNRIYAVGFSGGGGLVNLLACDPTLSSSIAAYAIASGAFFRGTPVDPDTIFDPKLCNPNRTPIPMIEFHGDEDNIVGYDGKQSFDGPTYSIIGWLKSWAERNNCAFNKGEKEILNHGKVDKYNWECKDEEGKVFDKPILQHYLLHGVEHTWPSVPLPLTMAEDADANEFDATEVILKFFGEHELPEEGAGVKEREKKLFEKEGKQEIEGLWEEGKEYEEKKEEKPEKADIKDEL